VDGIVDEHCQFVAVVDDEEGLAMSMMAKKVIVVVGGQRVASCGAAIIPR